MERTIYASLLSWKNRTDRKPLILLGARQVGKTYILKQFGQKEFTNLVYLNCHQSDFAASLFSDFDIQRIIYQIEIHTGSKIIPGETLLVFDEIQEVAGGIASLKYFCEDLRELHVAVAGSLLGISLRENESYPVGKVQTLHLYPMSFFEFVKASQKPTLCNLLCSSSWDLMIPFHAELTELLRQYYFTGGMPEAVAQWLSTHNPQSTRDIQLEILDSYYRDFSKHSKSMVFRIHQVWNCIPAQLAKENKKFIFGLIKKGARATEFEQAIQWLVDAGLIYKIERCTQPLKPLKFYSDHSAFKIYLNDCGLLAALTEANPQEILLGNKAFTGFKGALTENYLLQQIMPLADIQTFYFSKDNSTQEIDFLIQTPQRIIPCEAKAEENVKAKSLSQFVKEDHIKLQLKGLRCSILPYIDQGWMENIPLYGIETYFKTLSDI